MSMLQSIAHQLSRENFGNCQPYSCHYYEWWRESGTERELMNHPQQGTQGRCFFVADDLTKDGFFSKRIMTKRKKHPKVPSSLLVCIIANGH